MNAVDNINPNPNPNRTAISRDLPVREVLEDEARKALLFLKALARHPALRAQLADAGYTQAEHDEGFRLFFVAHGHGTRPGDAPMDAASQALEEIESWQATNFARAAAVLIRKHREEWRLVFGDELTAERGRASITSRVSFLDRLDRIESTNANALATLAARGIDEKVRKHLRHLVDVATAKADGMLTLDNAAQQKRLAALIQLFRWYSEWELTARLVAAPRPPAGSFDPAAAKRGDDVFSGAAKCATCHFDPGKLTETGWHMHTGAEIGVDDFQSSRAPDKRYRTTPLHGLWAHQKGGFYHDGRFATLLDVVNHYDRTFGLGLTEAQKADLVEYLKSL